MKREVSSGSAIALLLVLVALAAMAEVLAGRPATVPEAPRPSSSAAVLRLGDEARALGDHAAVEQALAMAAPLAAGGDDAVHGRLAALRARAEPAVAGPSAAR